jgi:hypothetical protein
MQGIDRASINCLPEFTPAGGAERGLQSELPDVVQALTDAIAYLGNGIS